MNAGTEQVPQDGASVLGADDAASAAPADGVTITMLGSDMKDSVCSFSCRMGPLTNAPPHSFSLLS
jgi:hypothetical protein